tara:strand:+ start:1765 stop:3558 length:1794 start_codon:yes stop_codon:yes gene_type:complete
MSGFFTSSDKIKVGQTEVSVPSENGLNYNAGGRIELYIPPTSKFIDLSQSKLKMDVTLSVPTVDTTNGVQRVQLDAQTGLHSLIRSVRLFSGRKTVLLEEIEGYDILTALRFDYETNESLKSKRALGEGATSYDPACRGTLGTTKTVQGNCFSNPYLTKVDGNPVLSTSYETTDADYGLQKVKGELHLNTGLFRNEAVFPSLLTDGLFVEILLQDAKKVFRTLDSTNRYRRLRLNPVYHSINGSDAGRATNGSFAHVGASANASSDTFYFTHDNNQTSVATFPMVVGEKVTFVSGDNASVNGSIARITQIEQVTGGVYGISKTKVTLSEAIQNTTGETWTGAGTQYHLMSFNADSSDISDYPASYVVSNVEMIVRQISVPDGYEASMMSMMKEGGTINYDYRSFTNYRYSQLAGDNVANIRLPLIESRATAALCVPCDATQYSTKQLLSASSTYLVNEATDDVINRTQRSAIVGISDGLQEYQWIYDSKINPNRKVDVSKISAKNSVSQYWSIEAEKALAMSDIEPMSFLGFQDNFFVGRALALGKNAVYDTRGKDFVLQVEYTDQANPQTKPKLWNNFISHIRRLEIKNGGLSLSV